MIYAVTALKASANTYKAHRLFFLHSELRHFWTRRGIKVDARAVFGAGISFIFVWAVEGLECGWMICPRFFVSINKNKALIRFELCTFYNGRMMPQEQEHNSFVPLKEMAGLNHRFFGR